MHKSNDHRVAVLFHIRQFLPWPFRDFIVAEAAGGVVLLIATIAALLWANTPWLGVYEAAWSGWRHLINEGFMTIFFLVVGLEIKREFIKGELQGVRTALLPTLAAIGGMIVPALIYLKFNLAGPGSHGWAIPMATDIVFASAVLAALGNRVPTSLKLFLLVLAIVDDIGAIFVIGLFYSGSLSLAPLLGVIGVLGLTLWLKRFTKAGVPIFLGLTAALWYCLHAAGVQASIAGAIIGLFAPVAAGGFSGLSVGERLERLLFPVATFIIIPLFALANAGVAIAGVSFGDHATVMVALGIFGGLLIGKIVGITGVAWLLIRSGIARLPKGVSWSQMVGVASVAGIGFTVALFVADLSFAAGSNLQSVAKLSILVTSIVSAAIGVLLLRRIAR